MGREGTSSGILARVVAGSYLLAPALAYGEDVCAGKGGRPEREECSVRHFEAGRFREAAGASEALWEESGELKHLLNASVAREAAGSDGWALCHLLKYLQATELTERERDAAQSRVEQLRKRLTPVPIELAPIQALGSEATLHFRRYTAYGTESFVYPLELLTAPSGLMVVLEAGDWSVAVIPRSPAPAYDREYTSVLRVRAGSRFELRLEPVVAPVTFSLQPPEEVRHGVDLRLIDPYRVEHPVTLRLRGPTVRMHLRIGDWIYQAKQRRLSPWLIQDRITVRVDEEGAPENSFTLYWRASAEDRMRRERLRKVTQGLGGGGAGLVTLGSVLLGVGLDREHEALHPVLGGSFAEQRPVRAGQSLVAWGGGLVGAGLGAAASAGLERVEPSTTRAVLTYVSGGSLAVVGLIWHVGAFVSYSNTPKVGAPEGEIPIAVAEGRSAGAAMSAGVLGLGVSLVSSAMIAHLVRSGGVSRRRARAALHVGPQGPAVTIEGRF